MEVPLWIWVAFAAFVLLALALDLFVFHREAHEISLREATVFSVAWIALGIAFGLVVWVWQGAETSGEYFAGYLIEKALSVDNVFVFALIFAYFAVPAKYQHRVLFWGVVGALVMRAVLIVIGAQLLETYDWIIYFFGTLLVVTGVRMALHRQGEVQPERNPVLRVLRRTVPITDRYHGQRLWVRAERLEPRERPARRPLLGVWVATPLLAVLVAVETTDLVFAIDSIPAIFAITSEPFIVFTSNVFALLGLRALYFMLAGAIERFVYLKAGLSLVLVFVGVKFLLSDVVGKVPIYVSLPFITTVVGVSIAASLWRTRDLPGGQGPVPPTGAVGRNGALPRRADGTTGGSPIPSGERVER